MVNKKLLRKKYVQKRKELSPEDAEQLSRKICEHFFTLPNITGYHVFHTYLPIEKNREINTFHIVKKLWGFDKKIVVPRMKKGLPNMDTCILTAASLLITNVSGVPEPAECQSFPNEDIDVVIIPLLSFDKKGYRIGYGKGYYDRFLSDFQKPVFKVGLSYFDPVPEDIERNQWDVPMDCCITPETTYWF